VIESKVTDAVGSNRPTGTRGLNCLHSFVGCARNKRFPDSRCVWSQLDNIAQMRIKPSPNDLDKGEKTMPTPYLFFDGRCEEAIEFYKKALGAKVEMMMRFKDSPEPPPPQPILLRSRYGSSRKFESERVY
jgi:hypothetical protein